MGQKIVAKQKTQDEKQQSSSENSGEDKVLKAIRASRTEGLRKKVSTVGSLKIAESTPQLKDDWKDKYHNSDDEEEPVLVLRAANKSLSELSPIQPFFRALYIFATISTALWFAFCLFYVAGQGVTLTPQSLALFFGTAFAPPALLWMFLTNINRRSDIKFYSETLREELQSLLFPSEETAHSINKDVKNLCEQAAEVSAASKAVLKSLQRARQGLRVEVRDFAGVSRKAEFHIDRLSEILSDKSSRLLSLTEEIEQRTANIDQKVQAGAEAWDEATVKILDRAGEMESVFDKGAEKILQAADKAHDRTIDIEEQLRSSYEGLSRSVDDVAKRFETLTSDFGGYTDGLYEAADHVTKESQRITDIIGEQIRGLEETADRSIEAMAKSTETIQSQKDLLDEGARSVARHSEDIAVSISSSVEGLNTMVSEVIKKTEGLGASIQEKTDNLHNAIKGIAKQADTIEEAGKHAANQLNEALSVAISGAGSISSAVRKAVDSLEKSTQTARGQAEELMDTVKQNISEMNQAGEGNISHIKEMVNLLEKSQARIMGVTETTRAHVKELSEAVGEHDRIITLSAETLKDRVESISNVLQKPLKDVQLAVNDADERHKAIEDVLRRRVSDLNEASEKATSSAEKIRNILKGQAQEISTISGQISGQARQINEQIAQQKDQLGKQVVEAVKNIAEVSTLLEKQAQNLNDISELAVQDVSALDQSIASRCDEISTCTAKAFARLEELDNAIGKNITVLKTKSEEASLRISNVNDNLKTSAEMLEPVYLKTVEQAGQAHKKFEELKLGYEESAASNLERLEQIGIIFDERLQALQSGSDEAAEVLRESSNHLQACTKEIEQASKKAYEKMQDISSLFEDQSSDIHLITDQALLKIESVQKALNEQFYELSASVGQAVSQIKDAGDLFVKQSEIVQTEAEKITQSFDHAGQRALDNSSDLGDASRKTVELTEILVAKVEKEAQGLLETTGESLFELKKAGDTFAIRAKEVSEQMKVSLKTSEAYTLELRQQALAIADSSAQSVEKISKATGQLTAKMDAVGSAAHDVMIKIGQSRESLGTEADRLLSVSSAALDGVKAAASVFGKQAESLFKASQDAMERSQDILKSDTRTQRESFMSSAKFIIESLHSLSVDISRMLEGDVSEKTWKAFQKGDVSAFTKKLVQMSGSMPLDKARDKYAKDAEFRTYVNRFIRQFEEMYDSACSNDHGALLTGTLGSSEVGKLYDFLCGVSGKSSKLSGAPLRAA